MTRDSSRQIVIVLATLATLIVNALANILPFNGLTTGAVSDSFKVYFVPAGYVFTIWGLIYLLLIGYTVFQALPAQRAHPILRKIGWLYVLSAAANCGWIFLWHYQQFPFTLVLMAIILVSLILIYLKLGIPNKPATLGEKLFIRLPFSIYLGWITVATIANVTDVLYYFKWNGFGLDPQLWAVIMLAVALVIAGLMTFTRHDAAYLAVLIWAFIGIAIKFASNPMVGIAAWVASAIVGIFFLISLVWSQNKIYQKAV